MPVLRTNNVLAKCSMGHCNLFLFSNMDEKGAARKLVRMPSIFHTLLVVHARQRELGTRGVLTSRVELVHFVLYLFAQLLLGKSEPNGWFGKVLSGCKFAFALTENFCCPSHGQIKLDTPDEPFEDTHETVKQNSIRKLSQELKKNHPNLDTAEVSTLVSLETPCCLGDVLTDSTTACSINGSHQKQQLCKLPVALDFANPQVNLPFQQDWPYLIWGVLILVH